jgi:hypothetical protein
MSTRDLADERQHNGTGCRHLASTSEVDRDGEAAWSLLEAHGGKRGGKPKVKTAFDKASGAAFIREYLQHSSTTLTCESVMPDKRTE